MTTPNELDHAFRAPIETDGAFPYFLTVTDSAAQLGTRRPVKVIGTIDGHAFRATLMPSGDGPHWLPLRADLRDLIGKGRGDVVAVHLNGRQ